MTLGCWPCRRLGISYGISTLHEAANVKTLLNTLGVLLPLGRRADALTEPGSPGPSRSTLQTRALQPHGCVHSQLGPALAVNLGNFLNLSEPLFPHADTVRGLWVRVRRAGGRGAFHAAPSPLQPSPPPGSQMVFSLGSAWPGSRPLGSVRL